MYDNDKNKPRKNHYFIPYLHLPSRKTAYVILIGLLLWSVVDILISHIRWNGDRSDGGSTKKQQSHRHHQSNQEELHYVQIVDSLTEPRDYNRPGEGGKPIQLSGDDEEKIHSSWRQNFFNEIASNGISFERSLQDYRPTDCYTVKVSNDLPPTSVIMTYCEEAWSTLLRSVHSVINRSPPELLEEIILIDDFSQRDYLKQPIDEYMERFPKVTVIHLKERHGLVRARLVGAALAKADVLTFLDSHIECTVGWLEPLLQRIKDERTNVACSVIDEIDSVNFAYTRVEEDLIGSFSWSFAFKWALMPEHEKKRRKSPSWPIKSPTMAGGIFSIEKNFFYEIGAYDPGFEIWGADNIDLSFRIWMCGGQIEFLPCSRVGHIFRNGHPFTFPGSNIKKTFHHNTLRLVEVWVEEPYKQVFFDHVPEMKGVDPGDLQERLDVRKNLQCKDFQWYLDNIHPDHPKPDFKYKAKGTLRSRIHPQLCLTNVAKGRIVLMQCANTQLNQVFFYTVRDTIESDGFCVTAAGDQVKLGNCHPKPSSIFKHTKGDKIVEMPSGRCLSVQEETKEITFDKCRSGLNGQRWMWEDYFDNNEEEDL